MAKIALEPEDAALRRGRHAVDPRANTLTSNVAPMQEELMPTRSSTVKTLVAAKRRQASRSRSPQEVQVAIATFTASGRDYEDAAQRLPGLLGKDSVSVFALYVTAAARNCASLVLLAAVLAGPSLAVEKSDVSSRLNELLDADFNAYTREYPHLATLFGVEGRNDQLLELTNAALERRDAHDREMLRQALEIQAAQLTGQDRISYELFVLTKRKAVEGQQFNVRRTIEYMDQFSGAHLWMPANRLFTPFTNELDYRNYIARLRSVSRVVDEAIALSRIGVKAGWVNAKAALERIPRQIDEQLGTPLDDDPLAAPLKSFPEEVPLDAQREISRELRAALADSYRPALARLRGFVVEELLPRAPASGGLAALPGGKRYYDFLIRAELSPELNADGIHALGLIEVRRIREELRALAVRAGFGRDVDAYMRSKVEDPKQYFSSAEELLAAYEALATDVEPKVRRLFHVMPRTRVEVQAMPAAEADADVSARYQPPSADGKRPGLFVLNTISYARRGRYEMVSMYLHEALPGHHMQIARALEISGLHRWRQIVSDSLAYSEGWALYAEKLGVELDLYVTDDSRFGRLRDELWRAARLVVDTGIHARGWTRAQAIAYMVEQVGLAVSDAAGEVDRYFVWPAQALGYKIGELKIFALRQKAQRALGSRFDIRDFHAAVIDQGAVPLPVLENLVNDWIARTARQ